METLQAEAVADICFGDEQALYVERVVVFGVGDRRLQHLAHVLGVALAGGGAGAVTAGAGLAADQQHPVRALGKGLEQHGPVDAAGARAA